MRLISLAICTFSREVLAKLWPTDLSKATGKSDMLPDHDLLNEHPME
jgi:hypothetical protein